MVNGKLKAAIVGMGFGGCFVPIWLDHPAVGEVIICDSNPERLQAHVNANPRVKTASFEEILADDTVDAVHLLTGIPDHAAHTVAVLDAGKHCACTVPMATTLSEIRDICAAVRRSGKHYMMMETTLYTYQFFYITDMIRSGELGRIQMMRGSHYQDMEYWPEYWDGLPPFWYGTHALAPMIALSGSRVERVSCLGSGTMRSELVRRWGNPFPAETTHLRFANGLAGEATRTLFETARVYQEGLSVYGSKKSFEWGFADGDAPYVTTLTARDDANRRGGVTTVEQITLPNYFERLPEPLWKYTVGGLYDPENPQESLTVGAGGGHHGSHAHLVHEFVSSIIEGRKPWIDEELAGNITAAGICSHESALRDGEWITVPRF